jgi:TolB protein
LSAAPRLQLINITGGPPLNNDHVLDPDGAHIYLSAWDVRHLYRARHWRAARRSGFWARRDLTDCCTSFMAFRRTGSSLPAGVEAKMTDGRLQFLSAEICTLGSEGLGFRQITKGGAPADGPEYSPDGKWLYFNTEALSGHAQIARMRPDGTGPERLTDEATVDWFPHLSPDGQSAVYLAYPRGTKGHPADLLVELKLARNGDWTNAASPARLFGGQGTINVNSWSPDNRRFANVVYPME